MPESRQQIKIFSTAVGHHYHKLSLQPRGDAAVFTCKRLSTVCRLDDFRERFPRTNAIDFSQTYRNRGQCPGPIRIAATDATTLSQCFFEQVDGSRTLRSHNQFSGAGQGPNLLNAGEVASPDHANSLGGILVPNGSLRELKVGVGFDALSQLGVLDLID